MKNSLKTNQCCSPWARSQTFGFSAHLEGKSQTWEGFLLRKLICFFTSFDSSKSSWRKSRVLLKINNKKNLIKLQNFYLAFLPGILKMTFINVCSVSIEFLSWNCRVRTEILHEISHKARNLRKFRHFCVFLPPGTL